MLKNLCIKAIDFYRYFLSPLKPQSCRYYPTCSQYAISQFQYNNFFKALFSTTFRILRCNQFFAGGFDYPITMIKQKPNLLINSKIENKRLKTIFVPKDKQLYYIVKVIFK